MKKKSKKQLELESIAAKLIEDFEGHGEPIDYNLDEWKQALVVLGLLYKKPKKEKEAYPEYTDFIRIWDEKYHHIGLMMPRDGAKIKSLIKQTRQWISNNGHEPTPENCILLWEAFIKSLHKTWAHNKGLTTIDSKYFELLYEIKNGTKKINGYHGKNSADRFSDFADTGR